ncbi:MAG: hypothetical protein GWO07_03690 [Candidatus Dadabacteria bacterium]|nr:hypothetical protein [Candidatus Dadabacteria bacterium]NIS07867.1 hypothetical protein [Candidatus Dadabacteria bacterium]NIV42887.1 hypothetical protein [Candidatus Dadabacteria bacterium]NIX14857.1 hypothetical protein [Candidatus Dadabacteria bacterium]NIY21471.1 hypothetical protein [Candidatus Dadabacteria bacterium]
MNEIKMKRNLTVLIAVQFIFCLHILADKAGAADEYSLTPAQKHFTSILRGLPGILSVSWESPVSLWIRTSSRAVGSPPNTEKAQNLAKTLAERGKTALRQPLCVHIYQKKSKELAKSCVFF